MRKGLPGMLLLTLTLMAAAPAPKPVITLDGIATAAKLDATARTGIAKQVAALNDGLLKVVALNKSIATAPAAESAKLKANLRGLHTDCMKLHDDIVAKLDPDQQKAFWAYLHVQMQAAGIDMEQFHDAMMADSTHDHAAMHGAMSGMGHGG